MKPNTNFHNQYDVTVSASDRERALALFKKMSDAEPGLMQKAEVKIKDNIDGSVYIQINNTSAFGDKISNVVKQYLNTFKYKKTVNKPE